MIWAHLFCCKNDLHTHFFVTKTIYALFLSQKNLRILFLSRKLFARFFCCKNNFVRKVFARWKLPSGKIRLFGPLVLVMELSTFLYLDCHVKVCSAHIRFASGTTSFTFWGLKWSWQLFLLWFLMWRSSITCWVAIHILSWGGGRGRGFLTSFSESRWHLSKVSQLLDKLFTLKKVNYR